MDALVHLILFVAFWLAVIIAAYREPWWLPVPVGAASGFVLGLTALGIDGVRGTDQVPGTMAAAASGALSGLIVIVVRAVMRKVRRNPFE